MLIDRYINLLLGVFGTLPNGSRRLYFHSQNLNEDDRGKPKGWPWRGRWWLTFERRGIRELRLEWDMMSRFCHARLQADPGENEVALAVALPPLGLWLSVRGVVPTGWLKRFGWERWALADVSVHDWKLWWRFWAPVHSWTKGTPRWRDGSWSPGKTFFGPWVFEKQERETKAIAIPMPEGEYSGTATLYHATRGHKRSPFKHRNLEVHVDIPDGIPYSGKGENSWDCGQDGRYGWSGEAKSIEEAVGKVVGSVLKTRRKRGDPAKWPKSPAEQRAARESRKTPEAPGGVDDAGA